MKRLILAGAVAVLVTGCGTFNSNGTQASAPLPSPTPAVTKDQTVAAAGKVEAPMTIDLPAWYVKAPPSTEDTVWVTGTAVSSDLAMSRTKALLDAQVQLADKINGVVNALTKQNRQDDGGNVTTDRTVQTVKKVIVDTALTGMHLEDSKVMSENRGYRTFVLVRYPIGDANRMLKDRLSRNRSENSINADEKELDREIEARRSPPISAAPAPATPTAAVVVSPIASSAPASNTGQIQLLEVDNAEYKARRDAALQKPGAVVGRVTVQ